MNPIETRLCSSLAKIMPQDPPDSVPFGSGTALQGEVFSFQLAYSTILSCEKLKIRMESPLEPHIRIRSVEFVPVEWMPPQLDEDIVSDRLGFYPDILQDISGGEIFNRRNCWRSLWITVRVPEDCRPGTYPVKLSIFWFDPSPEVQKEIISTQCFSLQVLPVRLPSQTLKNTHWFHTDCLMSYYHMTAFSPEYWRIVENFIRNAADHGVNMLYTPLFTPPLDTAPDGDRPTVQLVKVKRVRGQYRFDLRLLGKWIRLARKCGIRYFEMSHLFTQGGAAHVPKIMAEIHGKEERLFPREMPSDAPEYAEFLHSFLPQLASYLKRLKLQNDVYFHCSDEPGIESIETYSRASGLMRRLLPGFKIFDALCNVEFFRDKRVMIPVPLENSLENFMPENVPERWTYYCCLPRTEYSNRFIYMTSPRNRIFGALLYRYGVEGFLHWGWNFYYAAKSLFAINPYHCTCSNYSFPAGDAFLVYPGKNGVPEDSLRLEVFYEALQDQRALQLLESRIGREKVEALLDGSVPEGKMTLTGYPRGEQAMLDLRTRINRALYETSTEI